MIENNSNDLESEIESVQKSYLRSEFKDIDECKIDSKIAQESFLKEDIALSSIYDEFNRNTRYFRHFIFFVGR